MNQLRFTLRDRIVGKGGALYIGGKIGTVVSPSTGHHDYGIQFDEPVKDGHDLGSDVYKYGHCRWVQDDELDPYNEVVPESAPYFADARVGDSVYDMFFGACTIREITQDPFFLIKVSFENHSVLQTYTMNGKMYDNANQTLFYSKPVFALPPPPKRKVKKVVGGWVNIYKDTIIGLYLTKSDADSGAVRGRLGEAGFIQHEYEELT